MAGQIDHSSCGARLVELSDGEEGGISLIAKLLYEFLPFGAAKPDFRPPTTVAPGAPTSDIRQNEDKGSRFSAQPR